MVTPSLRPAPDFLFAGLEPAAVFNVVIFRVKNLWVLIAPEDTYHPALLLTAELLRGRAGDSR